MTNHRNPTAHLAEEQQRALEILRTVWPHWLKLKAEQAEREAAQEAMVVPEAVAESPELEAAL